jgi:ABC-type transport system involved in multi-copper enzyme maturation permease subunit
MTFGSIARSLNPFSPVAVSELRIASRRKRNYLLRVLYLGVLFLILLAETVAYSHAQNMSAAQRIQNQSEMAETFFGTFAVFSIVAMALTAPIVTSTAINAERLQKTLPALLMTPMSSWQIITGKLFARLLTIFMLLGLSLPVLAIVRLLGSIEVWQMSAAICLAVAMAIAAGAIGLFFSTVANRTITVILFSYGFLFALYALVPMGVVAIIEHATPVNGGGPGSMTWMNWFYQLITLTNPMVAVVALIDPPPRAISWQWCAAFHLGLAAVAVAAAGIMLRWQIRREGSAAISRSQDEAGSASTAGAAKGDADSVEPAPAPTTTPPSVLDYAALGRARRAGPASRTVGDRPIFWHEVRSALFVRRWQSIVAAIVLSGVMLLVYASTDFDPAAGDRATVATVLAGTFWLVISVLAATAIAHEKERDTWATLIATPLRGGDVVLGKLAGIARRMFGLLVLIAISFVVFMPPHGWVAMLASLWVIVSFNSVWAAVGLYLSLRVRKVVLAAIYTLGLAALVYLLAPICLAILDDLNAREGRSFSLSDIVWTYLPYFYISGLFNSASTIECPFNTSMSYPSFLETAVLVGFAHTLLAGVILWHTAANFDRLVGRAPQKQPLAADSSATPPATGPLASYPV